MRANLWTSVRPCDKALKRLEVGFSTIEIKKPEFRNEDFGLPSLSFIPKGFMLGLRLDLLQQIQTAMDVIGKIMTDSFKLEDPMGPFKSFFASTIWSPLADWPFMVSFDIEEVKFCLSTALEFSDGGLPIGDIRFKSIRVTFCAVLNGDLAFTGAGEIVMFYDIYPPLEIFNTIFGWMKPGCNMDDPNSDCKLFPTLKPMAGPPYTSPLFYSP